MTHVLLSQPRQNGKMAAHRERIDAADHVHVYARDGLWCVTRQPIGLLWRKLR